MSADEVICKQLVELVTDYLDGVLDPVIAARFDAHLLECDGCTNYLSLIHISEPTRLSLVSRMPSSA